MATQVIDTPGGITFAGFYYPEILRELLDYLRLRKEELGLTDENMYEVHVQLLRAFANVGHLNNTRLDTVATELLIDSCNLLESAKRLLRLMGIELKTATPAVVSLVMKLSEVTTVDTTEFIPSLSAWATRSSPPLVYEALDGSDLARGDRVGYVYGLEQVETGTGSVDVSAPSTFTRSGGSWPSDVVGQHLFVSGSYYDNSGEFRVTERLSNTDVTVVRIPGSVEPAFESESGLTWRLCEFTDDYAVEAYTPSSSFQPWATVHAGDCLYIGHDQIMTTRVDLTFVTPGDDFTGVWEYFDDERSLFNPDSVTDNGSTLTLVIDALIGSADAALGLGTEVRVTCLKTGSSEVITSTHSGMGGNNRVTTRSLLGQITPSTDVTDYTVTAAWVPFAQQSSDTDYLRGDDYTEWELPQTEERSWLLTDVNLVEAMWFRFRVTAIGGGPTAPVIEDIDISQGDQYVSVDATQGETVGPRTIGSSTGRADQEFLLPDTPFLDDSELVEVDESGAGVWVTYTKITSLTDAGATTRAYVIEVDSKDQAKIRFGDGVNGKIPPAGASNIRATYRIGGDTDGNVGPDTILSNEDGVNGISEVWNPRPATGWRMKDGGTEADLKRIKRDGPARTRTRGTASNCPEVERMAREEFVDDYGTKPVARAWAVEEGFGPKTVKLIAVGAGGTLLSRMQLDACDLYFNGDRYARPPVKGVFIANHRVTTINYSPSLVTVQATVSWSGGSAAEITNALLAYLTPLALEDDGATYVWDFEDQVSFSRVYALIHAVSPQITDVPLLLLNGEAESINLGMNQLPVTTAASISISVQG